MTDHRDAPARPAAHGMSASAAESAGPAQRAGGRLDPQAWRSPVVGVLGGLGPAATAVFLDLLVRATDVDRDQDHLDLLVSQHASTPDRTARILDESAPDPGPVLGADARMLERAGVDLLVLPCNTAHHFVKHVEDAVSIPLVSIVEATAERAAVQVRESGAPIAVFATEGNIHARVYQDAIEAVGARALVPERDLQDRVNTLIYDQVKAGRPVDRDLFAACVDEAERLGAGAVILGCTELSVIYDQHGFRDDARLVDSLTELARRTILAADRPLRPEFA